MTDLILSLVIVGLPVAVIWRARVLHQREITAFERAEAEQLRRRRDELADAAFLESAHRRMTRRRERKMQADRFRRVS